MLSQSTPIKTPFVSLLCPIDTVSPLQREGNELFCPQCRLSFPIDCDIPVLLKSAAQSESRERLADEYEKFSKTPTESIAFYNKFYEKARDYGRFPAADQAFVRALSQKLRFTLEAQLLDVGAGTGYFGKLIENVTGIEVFNADFSIEGFQTARNHYGLKHLFVMDAYNLAFADNSFDAVFAIGLTPYKKMQREEVAELTQRIARVLKPNGHFIFIFSTDLSGEVKETRALTPEATKTFYYNHSRTFIKSAFESTGVFERVDAYAFLRPLAPFLGRALFTQPCTLFTELVIRLLQRKFSARLVVIAKKR